MKRTGRINPKRAPRRRDTPQEDYAWWQWATEQLLIRSGGRCERCNADLYITGIERHHRQRRRDGGDTLPNLLALCPSSHKHITEHPEEARANGWIVSAHHPNPASVPVRINGYWWLLDAQGRKHAQP